MFHSHIKMMLGRSLISSFRNQSIISSYLRTCSQVLLSKSHDGNYRNTKTLCTDVKADYVPLNIGSNTKINPAKQILLRGKSATEFQERIIADFISSHEEASFEEWDKLLIEICDVHYGLLSETNIDARIIDRCRIPQKLELARSYLAFMKHKKRKFNGAVVCNFLKVCYDCRSSLKDVDMQRIKTFVEFLLNRHPIVESVMGDGIVKGLVLLNRVDEGFAVLENIKKTGSINVSTYSTLALCLLEKNELDRAKSFIIDVMAENLNFSSSVFVKWIEISRNDKVSLDYLMNVFSRFEYKPKKIVCDHLISAYDNLPDEHKLIGNYGTITNGGVCQVCHQKLKEVELDIEEFEHLRDVFLNKVLVGTDIFKNTTPDELQKFFRMVETYTPFDVVIDGLNVAFMIGSNVGQHTFVKLIGNVLRHFRQQDMKILLIGRKHMRKWPRFMDTMAENDTKVFLIDDVSEDDPFIIYSTLYSGLQTKFVTRDLMRTHKYNLSSDKDAALFKRWQHSHQIFITFVTPTGRVFSRTPITFQQAVHPSKSGGWHVPYREDSHAGSDDYGIHRNWLCLQPFRREKVE